MAQEINRVPLNTIPKKWAEDREIGPFIREILNILYQARERVGGDSDLVASVDAVSSTNFYAGGLLPDLDESKQMFPVIDQFQEANLFSTHEIKHETPLYSIIRHEEEDELIKRYALLVG